MAQISQLAAEAEVLRKAGLMAFAWIGIPPSASMVTIPKYRSFSVRTLKDHIGNLETIMGRMLGSIVEGKLTSSQQSKLVRWLAARYNEWERQSWGILSLGRVQDVEVQIGRLAVRQVIDCPPYGELLIQGFESIAIRHPEYHLVRDLALVHTLFRCAQHDASLGRECIKLDHLASGMAPASTSMVLVDLGCTELNQSLARMVILACFNLLEAFASGLAIAWLMEHPTMPPGQVHQLCDKSQSLKKRLLKTARFVTKRPDLFDEQKPPFEPLFRDLKCMRDAFVHCEPGETPTKWGYVKEELFHDVPAAAVEEAVVCTETIICETWKALTGRDRPTWFPQRLPNGRFDRLHVKLVKEE